MAKMRRCVSEVILGKLIGHWIWQ